MSSKSSPKPNRVNCHPSECSTHPLMLRSVLNGNAEKLEQVIYPEVSTEHLRQAEVFLIPEIHTKTISIDSMKHEYFRLPYPVVWFEVFHSQELDEDDNGEDLDYAIISSGHLIQILPDGKTTRWTTFIKLNSKKPRILGPLHRLEMDYPILCPWEEAGNGMYYPHVDLVTSGTSEMLKDNEFKFFYAWSFANTTLPVMRALHMMTCRNVEYVERTGSAPKKFGKRPPIPYTYKTLVVRNSRNEIVCDLDPIRKTDKGEMPLHTVRGHFKTYTEERPLLGRHVGRYWFPSHIRGHADNGIVEKVYQVEGQVDETSNTI